MDDQRQPTVEVETDPPDGSPPASGAATCELCDQRVEQGEAVTVAVGDAGRETMCAFCAGSLFDDLEVDADTGPAPVERADDADPVAPTAGTDATAPATGAASASAVTWEPDRPRSRGALGTLLRAHYLSLSLLWAIHRTNVRLTERVLEEVDVQLLATLTVVLSSVVLVVLGLAAGLGGLAPAAG
jgi:hypothetical protein